jgi:transcriptional regulator with PAS, ATPase and Fis domain
VKDVPSPGFLLRPAVKVYIRVVSATTLDVEGKVKKGEFREVLYFRLNMISIYIPPLRKRKEDRPLPAQYFIMKAVEKSTGHKKNAASLLGVSFPGLRHRIEKLNMESGEGEVMKISRS